MEPTPEQVWMKVLELYSSTTSHDQRTAVDTWLKAYQQSPSAWDSLAVLLRADGQGLDPQQVEQVHFFAANSLRSLCSVNRQFDSLSQGGWTNM